MEYRENMKEYYNTCNSFETGVEYELKNNWSFKFYKDGDKFICIIFDENEDGEHFFANSQDEIFGKINEILAGVMLNIDGNKAKNGEEIVKTSSLDNLNLYRRSLIY